VDSVNIMDGDPMLLSSCANKRSSWAFGRLIRDPRMEAEGLVTSCQGSSQGFCMLAAASTPMAAPGDKRAMRQTLIT